MSKLNSSMTPDQWQQRMQAAIQQVSQKTYALNSSTGRNQVSLQQLIFDYAETILAIKQKGVTYKTIAEQLTEAGIPISAPLLICYLNRYRKQNKRSLESIPAEVGSRAERYKRLRHQI